MITDAARFTNISSLSSPGNRERLRGEAKRKNPWVAACDFLRGDRWHPLSGLDWLTFEVVRAAYVYETTERCEWDERLSDLKPPRDPARCRVRWSDPNERDEEPRATSLEYKKGRDLIVAAIHFMNWQGYLETKWDRESDTRMYRLPKDVYLESTIDP